jgi:hypothetical protein
MRIAILTALLLVGASARAAPEAHPGTAGVEERGAELLQPFKKQLMGALKEGLSQGPAEAVDTCHLQAPGIPDRAAPENVELGRTSHKLRNPDNAPTDWQREIVQYYLHHEDRSPKTRRLDDGRVAYAEPIEVKPLCVTCHGPAEQIPAPVRAKLSEQYPDDQATGFEVGDFRGIFWATWPVESTEGSGS